jgi:hypothetical protein
MSRAREWTALCELGVSEATTNCPAGLRSFQWPPRARVIVHPRLAADLMTFR